MDLVAAAEALVALSMVIQDLDPSHSPLPAEAHRIQQASGSWGVAFGYIGGLVVAGYQGLACGRTLWSCSGSYGDGRKASWVVG